MALRFRRSVKLVPGVRLNLGLHGAGLSVSGLHVGVNRRGMYASAGIPGTGLYAVRHVRSSPGDPTVTGAAGFLVGLLIAAVVIVVVAIAGFSCRSNREPMLRWAVRVTAAQARLVG